MRSRMPNAITGCWRSRFAWYRSSISGSTAASRDRAPTTRTTMAAIPAILSPPNRCSRRPTPRVIRISRKLRKAMLADVPALQALIARSARALSTQDYRPSQVEGALKGAFGVDTQLLADQTYYVVEEAGQFVGCGGWSFRSTLFGGDARKDRDSSLLDPKIHAAKIRAFFVAPSHARRGIGSLLLDRCEQEAREHGFSHMELMATLPGVKLYAVRGYEGTAVVHFDVGCGETIEFIPMRKTLSP